MIVEIQYRDKADWSYINKDGQNIVVNWTNYSKKFKHERIQPHYVPPVSIKDIWNGKEFDVQHIRWTSCYFEMFIKESEIESFNQMASCSDINIIQYDQSPGGAIINNSYENIDLISTEFFEISEPERAADTSGWKVSIIFRTDRTVINKALPVLESNKINFVDGLWRLDYTNTIPGFIDAFDRTNIASLAGGAFLLKWENRGGNWQSIGNTLNVGGLINRDITMMAINRVAILGTDAILTTYDFNGTDWSQVGNPFSIGISPISSRVTYLSDSKVAILNITTPNITTYDFNGTDWSQLGNPLSISSGTADIVAMTATKIALIDETSKELRDYNFDGTNWTVNQTIVTTLSGNVGIGKLESNRIVLCSETEKILKSYELNASWALEPGSLSNVIGGQIIVGLDTNTCLIAGQGNYNYGNIYLTDFDILDWIKESPDVKGEWAGNLDHTIQSISKVGLQSVFYLTTDTYDEFIADLKNTENVEINDILLTEPEFESSEIGENLWKVIINGVQTKTVINKAIPLLNTNYIIINSATYYTDFSIEIGEKVIENIEIEWFDGSIKLAQSTYKQTWSLLFYFTGAQLDNFQSDFRQSRDKNINGITTQEVEMTTELAAENYYRIVVKGVIQTIVTNHNITPNNDYSLSLSDGTPELFYTDYAPELISESPDINTVNNQTGINTPTKAINKTVRQLKFFLNEVDKDRIKQKFELYGTTGIINPGAIAVLEAREVTPTKLGVDLYEVLVNCLTASTIN